MATDFNIDDVNAIFHNTPLFLSKSTEAISSPDLSFQLGVLIAGIVSFVLLIILIKFFGKTIINKAKDIFTGG